jgi:hypothetical protein
MDEASRRYAYVFDFRRPIHAPNHVHVPALVDGDLKFIVEGEIRDDDRRGECDPAIGGALVHDATLIGSAHHRYVIARIHDCELPEYEARRGR